MKSRIVEHRHVKASTLRPHPSNWRTHPEEQQAALRASLDEIGFSRSLVAYNDPEWGLTLIDGHLRAETLRDETVTVEVVDLTRDEAKKLLATVDAVAGMAETDEEKLAALVAEIESESEAFAALLAEMLGQSEAPGTQIAATRGEHTTVAEGAVELKALDATPPAKMAWVLIGIATVRFGEISDQIQALSRVEGLLCETTVGAG